MALSGFQPALMYARAGLARSGATRSGYYQPFLVLELDGILLNAAEEILAGSLVINQAINDEADTARFTIVPDGVTMVVGQRVTIGLGTAQNALFGGQVLRVTHRRLKGNATHVVFQDVECIDYLRMLDAHLVTTEYRSQSATAIFDDLLARWVSPACGISNAGVARNMPALEYVPVTNERPSTVMRRVMNTIGGGFYVDPLRVVHAWASDGEPGLSNPQPLTNDLPTLKEFSHTYDLAQVRTRVIAEGLRSSTPAGVPARSVGYLEWFPVDDVAIFFPLPAEARRDGRVGTQSVVVHSPSTPRDPALNVPGSTLRLAAVSPANSLTVEDATFIAPPAPPGLLRIEEQVIFFNNVTMSPGNHVVSGIPGPGAYLGIAAPLGAGSAVTEQPFVSMITGQAPRAAPLAYTAPFEPLRAQPAGTPVVLVVKRDAVASQAHWAAIEQSDGVYEHLVQDGRWNVGGATARADAELELFQRELLTASWVTVDLNAAPGRAQQVEIHGHSPLSATITIQTVTLTFPVWGYPPFRACMGSSVKVSTLAEIAVTDSR